MQDSLSNSTFGVHIELANDHLYCQNDNDILTISRGETYKEGIAKYSLRFENKGSSPVKIFSAVVADFRVSYKFGSFLEHGWLQSSPSSYKKPHERTRANKLMLKRDYNPHSFAQKYGYLARSIVSEWFTCARSSSLNLACGATTTADNFCQVYVREEDESTHFVLSCQFDGITLQPGASMHSETIAVVWGEENPLARFMQEVAQDMHVMPRLPSLNAICCSYYWNSNCVDERIVAREVELAASNNLPLDYVQIDAGYCENWGDWFDTTLRFPAGFEKCVQNIEDHGFKAGLWIAPLVAHPGSKLFRDHPQWFLRNAQGKFFEGRLSTPFDRLLPQLSFRVLDPTNTEYQEYLSEQLRKLRGYGFNLFKLDFLYPAIYDNSLYKVELTRAQALSRFVTKIRTAVGDAVLTSAISPLSPLVGIVDSARVGIDTLNPAIAKLPLLNRIVNNTMLRQNLAACTVRTEMNQRLWLNDPDVMIWRNGTGLSNELRQQQQDFVKRSKSAIWIGDSLTQLTREQLKEVKAYFIS